MNSYLDWGNIGNWIWCFVINPQSSRFSWSSPGIFSSRACWLAFHDHSNALRSLRWMTNLPANQSINQSINKQLRNSHLELSHRFCFISTFPFPILSQYNSIYLVYGNCLCHTSTVVCFSSLHALIINFWNQPRLADWHRVTQVMSHYQVGTAWICFIFN